MTIYPIVVTGSIGAGKTTICKLLVEKLKLPFIKEYIDLDNNGEKMLCKFKSGIVSNKEFQRYILENYKQQLDIYKKEVVIMERLPEEGGKIFCSDPNVLVEALVLQEKYDIYSSNATVITVDVANKTPSKIADEIICKIFDSPFPTFDLVQKRILDLGIVIVYLKSTPELCKSRIEKRNRKGEDDLTIEVLQNMCDSYEKYIAEIEQNNFVPYPIR